MRRPVVIVPERKMSYSFMAAEAYWIISGDNRVATIAPYNARIAQYSDDGETFFGAYGPRIDSQLDYVVGKFIADRETRQAGLTIWRENPPETKDYPCTIAMFFNLRDCDLNCHVFMRSSDQWFGVPYDIFNFSCVSYLICCRLNAVLNNDTDIKPGTLYLTAASSHLYDQHWVVAKDLPHAWPHELMVPRKWYTDELTLKDELRRLREKDSVTSSLRWWLNA
jgi:thymidylate synthase